MEKQMTQRKTSYMIQGYPATEYKQIFQQQLQGYYFL
jgi:hypothetical protein